MQTWNHLKEILLELEKAGVSFIVCGGVAVVLHGVERMTLDLDISLAMDEDNLRRFLQTMTRGGLRPRAPVSGEILLDPEKVAWLLHWKKALVFSFIDPDNPFRQVDVFLTENCRFEALAPHATTMTVEGVVLRVISREKLIEMKRDIQPIRPKDLADIEALSRLGGRRNNSGET